MRTVAEEPSVTGKIDNAAVENPRVRDIYDGIIWRLSRAPEDGYQIPETDPAYLMKIDCRIPEVPGIIVLYTFDNELVNILDVKILNED